MSSLIKLRRQPRADVTPKATLRILLISPSYAPTRNVMYFPIGLSYVAAYVRKFGYEVVPLNMNHWDEAERYEQLDRVLRLCIGFALLLAALTYALRLWINLRRVRHGNHTPNDDPTIRILPTVLVGALGGLLVGITSVGSGSVIMIALLMLYPGLSAAKLVGTDLVQAVPLVLAAAISNITLHGLDWGVLIPLLIGSVPGTMIGSKIAPRVRQSYIRRGIVVVLTMSGVALLDKAQWAPLGAGEDETYPMVVAGVGLAMVILLPLVWGVLRRMQGMPMFGSPTVAELEDPGYRPGIIGMKRTER